MTALHSAPSMAREPRGHDGTPASREGHRQRWMHVLLPAILLGTLLISISPIPGYLSSFGSGGMRSSAVPGKPTITSAVGRNHCVDLVWTIAPVTPHDPIYFRLVRGYSAGGCNTWVCDIGYYGCPTSVSYTDSLLTNGVTYYYQVYSWNDDGTGPRSDAVSAMPVDAPSEPLNFVASGGNDQVSLSWVGPASSGPYPITNYKVYRGTASGSEGYLATIGNQWSWTDTVVTNGQRYYYTVRAVSFAGDGVMSAEATALPLGPPLVPRDLAIQAMNAGGRLTWSAPASDGGLPITNYTVFRHTLTSANTPVATIGNETQYIDAGLVNGENYFYSIRAVNSYGAGPSTSERWIQPGTPWRVQNLSAAGAYSKIVLTWEAPTIDGGAPITNYKVYRGTTSWEEALIAVIGNVTTYTDFAVDSDRVYYYRVSAVNDVMEGEKSSRVTATATLHPASIIVPAILGAIFLIGVVRLYRKFWSQGRRSRARDDGIEYDATATVATDPHPRPEAEPRQAAPVEPGQTAGPPHPGFKLTARERKALRGFSQAPTKDAGKAAEPHRPRSSTKGAPAKNKAAYPQRAAEAGTPVNRTVLKEYIERQRKEGARDLHYLKIKNDLGIISQKKSSKLYRILQELVKDEVLVRKGSNYIIVG